MIQDRVAISKPVRVLIGADRNSGEVMSASVVDELVAEFWVPEGAEVILEPWIEHGVRHQGWKMVRQSGAQVAPELDAEVGEVSWLKVAEDMAAAVRRGDVQEALDLHETAAMQQAMAQATIESEDQEEPDA